MADMENLTKKVDTGELSRDFGLDITVSDGGLVTSALNQRHYRAECGKLYQQFMLTMADYLFEETQIKKRLQSLVQQKKQPRLSAVDSGPDEDDDVTPEEEVSPGDEDAFSPSQMEEFRRLASSRVSQRGALGKTGSFVTQMDPPRVPTSISLQAPPRSASAAGRADTPHIFPALKERPLTHTATTRGRNDAKGQGAMMYGGRDDDCDGALDPTSDFSTNRRMRMNPRAFSKLSSSSRIKVTVKDKEGEFVMKPVTGRPGVVSLHGGGGAGGGGRSSSHPQPNEDLRYHLRDSKDKMALIKTITTFSTPTLSSELKTNNLVAIQKSLVGKEAKRMTVGEVMAKSRDRRARLFRVQMATGRLDDWYVPGENKWRRSSRTASSGDVLAGRSRSTRSSSGIPVNPRNSESSVRTRNAHDVVRARTAPLVRPDDPPTPNLTSRTDPESAFRSASPREQGHYRSHRLPIAEEPEEDLTPRVSVVHLQLPDSPKSGTQSSPPSSGASSQELTSPAVSMDSPQEHTTPRAGFAGRTDSVAQERKEAVPRSARLNLEKRKAEALDLADHECSVQTKHLETMRDSLAVVRRWKDQDREREEKLTKWRMRMSFAATRRGNLGKVLARV